MKKKIIISSTTIIALIIVAVLLFIDFSSPKISLTQIPSVVSRYTEFVVTIEDSASNIKNFSVTTKQLDTTKPLLTQEFSQGQKTQQVTFTLKDAQLSDGPFELVLTAQDTATLTFGKNITTKTFTTTMDSVPPRIAVTSPYQNIRQGGTGIIQYQTNEPLKETGIELDGNKFLAIPTESLNYILFYPFPAHLTPAEFNPVLFAEDTAGNVTKSAFPLAKITANFRHGRKINLPDSFLNAKDVEFAPETHGNYTPLERYLFVNKDIRVSNEATLVEIAKQTAPKALWTGAFMPLPRGSTQALFADARTYYYKDEEVDKQVHMGLDYASTARAEVPAGNDGHVVFAGRLGIFGNLVIIDHGLSLQSLYSHLSEIHVQAGVDIKRGDILGRTGVTGLAGGDHLHFGMTVQGIQVQPVEWLDAKWINDVVMDRIQLPRAVTPAEPVANP